MKAKALPTNKDPDPLEVCGAIRDSFKDAAFVYTQGSCFAFYQILKTIFPQAVPWTNVDHVWTEINGRLYDINGRRKSGYEGLTKMTDDPRLMERAHKWKWCSSWRVDIPQDAEDNSNVIYKT